MGPAPETRNGHIPFREVDSSFRNAVSIVECARLCFGGVDEDQIREVRDHILRKPQAQKKAAQLLEDISDQLTRNLGVPVTEYFRERVFLADPSTNFRLIPDYDNKIKEMIRSDDVLRGRLGEYRPLPQVQAKRL